MDSLADEYHLIVGLGGKKGEAQGGCERRLLRIGLLKRSTTTYKTFKG